MSARLPYTRWERDRGGKLRLATGTYKVIGEAQDRRTSGDKWIERACEALGALLLIGVAALVISAASGCAALPGDYLHEAARGAGVGLSDSTAPVALVQPPVLLLDPADEVRELTETAAAHFRDHGFSVETGPEGIPVAVADEVTYKGGPVDGRSHYDRWCFNTGCIGSADILISRGMLTSKPQIAQNSLEHEIAHIVSGWGACVAADDYLPMADKLHLTPGHLVSNGNSHYELVDWTTEDVALMLTCIVNGGIHGS